MSDTIRVLVVCAHPDEADEYAGGTAALFAELGHAVRFVSLTNGDVGHFREGGGQLAMRRHAEAQEAGARLGVEYVVMDTHDGELLPSLEVRRQVIAQIREWRANIVIAFHPGGGGHPDNRNAGKAVRDAMSFVGAPNMLPGVPALLEAPLCLLMTDYATQAIHRSDITIDIGPVIEKKLRSWDAHATQFYEFAPWGRGFLDEVPDSWEDKRAFLLRHWSEFVYVQPEMHTSLTRWYGAERASRIEFAESFQIADYGRQPSDDEIRRLFPMLPPA
jgi:LmbE family N-acetylglucosaminyl deacetylase